MKNHQDNEQNSLQKQKILMAIVFGKSGPWTKYFKALLFFGIDVKAIIQENYMLKNQIANR